MDHFSIEPITVALFIDLLVVLLCSVMILRKGRLAHSHPLTIYLVFHVYTFTIRLAGLAGGAPTLFSDFDWSFEPITSAEIVRAAVMGDAALIAMTVASIRAARDDLRKNGPMPPPGQEGPADLAVKNIWRVVIVAFPLGLVSLLLLSNLPGRPADRSFLGDWQSSSWTSIAETWSGLSLLALVYWYGFRRSLVVLLTIFFLLMVYQGYHRFRVIIPLLLLLQIYLDRHRLKWPPARLLPVIVIVALLFTPLKIIGRLAQEGASINETANITLEIIQGTVQGQADDQTFLDQFASAVTLIDRGGKFYYGSIFLPILTLPIPRQLWPDKPGLSDYLGDISQPWRPMKDMGMIITLPGESYLNFGYVGLLLVPALVAYVLTRIYFRAYRKSYYTAYHFAYLLIAANLLQVYRDGLISLVVFVLISMMPLVAIIVLNRIRPARPADNKLSLPLGRGANTTGQPFAPKTPRSSRGS